MTNGWATSELLNLGKTGAKLSKTTLAKPAGRVYALRSFWENPGSLWHIRRKFETIDLWQLKFA